MKFQIEGKIMKVVVYTKYGSPDVLELKEVESPVPIFTENGLG